MYERQPITGLPCDSTHPFPAPRDADWIDSMEYGSDFRLTVDKDLATEDRDTTPTWRLIGAWLWNTECLAEHLREVADEPYLTTHLLAVATLADPPRSGSDVSAALKQGGLEGAFHLVQAMDRDERKNAVEYAASQVMHGFTTLQLDIYAHFPGRKS